MVRMMKIEKESHSNCRAHANHLCVCDILCKSHKMNYDVIDDVIEEEDDYDEKKRNVLNQTVSQTWFLWCNCC